MMSFEPVTFTDLMYRPASRIRIRCLTKCVYVAVFIFTNVIPVSLNICSFVRQCNTFTS
jgi:hypothetical protein